MPTPMSAARPAAGATPLERVLSPGNRDVLIIAHRGDWARAPENSLAAVRGAIERGFDMVEIDVRLASDGVPVVIHDASLDRTTEGTGPMSALASAQLRALRLREGEGGRDAALTDERLPDLAAFLEEARGRILVNLDTKNPAELGRIAPLVADMGMAGEVVVKCEVKPEEAARLPVGHPAHGPLPFMPILETSAGRVAGDVRALARLSPLMIECHPEAAAILAEGREATASAGIRLWVNTIDCSHIPDFDDSRALDDPHAVWGRLVDWGVGAIQTDRGAELAGFLRQIGRRA
ncbi:glycerophosphodiester phosphodiesterase family protein [Aureimonas sp. AU4]|uniref:glycerophosphodiester phosphodiesterase family protein n=1 Tax=Aureimonas sp. AU4 TaxID=1638163 RepID=UPI000781C0DE|nr:glycerophosphodiester phosphodiesterase family protein [Aureimonas sp. AU4]